MRSIGCPSVRCFSGLVSAKVGCYPFRTTLGVGNGVDFKARVTRFEAKEEGRKAQGTRETAAETHGKIKSAWNMRRNARIPWRNVRGVQEETNGVVRR